MRKAARLLEDDGIAVIPVAIGDDADANELENLSPDVLQPPDGTEPDELAKMIMKEIYLEPDELAKMIMKEIYTGKRRWLGLPNELMKVEI